MRDYERDVQRREADNAVTDAASGGAPGQKRSKPPNSQRSETAVATADSERAQREQHQQAQHEPGTSTTGQRRAAPAARAA